MTLRFQGPDGAFDFAPTRCLVAGWTGRDPAKVAHHIEELAAIGVAAPSTTPLYYRVPAPLAVQGDRFEVLSADTGGEAEPVILDDGARLWLTLGSDHTDRGLEATSVAHSKALCPKPLAREAWPLEEVAARLDDLTLTTEISTDGTAWQAYQADSLAAMLPLAEIVAGAPGGRHGGPGAGTVLFCGTVPAKGGVRPTPYFRARLADPGTGREIALAYRIAALPVIA
ncbi:MAG: DUF2848 family protein [Pseudomonadota bacterium]